MHFDTTPCRAVAALAITRSNPKSPPGAAIRRVVVFIAHAHGDDEARFELHDQAFAGSTNGRDVADWLGGIIPYGAEIALRSTISQLRPAPSKAYASKWSPVDDTAWLRPVFGHDAKIWPLHLSDKDILETGIRVGLIRHDPEALWLAAGAIRPAKEAQVIWHRFLDLTRSAYEITCLSAARQAWWALEKARPIHF